MQKLQDFVIVWVVMKGVSKMREEFTVQVRTRSFPAWVNLSLFGYTALFPNYTDAEKELELAKSENLDFIDSRILSRCISDWQSVKGV